MITREHKAFIDAALSYSEQSPQWPIFPVHPTEKKPLIKTGTDHAANASTDADTVMRWPRRWPDCRIGLPTGAASGTIVVDIDAKHDGERLLAELERVLGPLPRVRMVRTRSGGLHIYLAHPGVGIRIKSTEGARGPLGKLLRGRPGVDVRSDGGMVVLPPSPGYVWLRDEDELLPPASTLWLLALREAGEPPTPVRRPLPPRRDGEHRWSPPERGPTISEGDRNRALYRRGAMLHLNNATDAEIVDDLLRVNAARISPPLPEREVMKIASSAMRATGRLS